MLAKFCKTAVFYSVIFLSAHVWAKKQHNHKAHVHGQGQLSIVFDNLEGRIEFKSAADGVLGFEHRPKSLMDKQKYDSVQSYWKENIQEIIQMDKTLNCAFKPLKVEQVFANETEDKHESKHGEHSDFIAEFSILCQKTPLATSVKIDLSHFKKIKTVDIAIVAGDLQKSEKYKGQAIVVPLQ